MNKHTPGPWATLPNGDVVGADGSLIAKIAEPIDMSMSEMWSNSELIAAAPDLLAALQQIASNADLYHPDTIREIATAAIAKATGGQP